MSNIIFLNGCGSSGKTSIVRAIQQESTDLWLAFGIDSFIEMIPFGKMDPYVKFIPGENEHGPTTRVELGPEAKKLFSVMPRLADMLASQGNNLLIDEVVLEDDTLKSYAEHLQHHRVYYIGIFCDLGVMQEREVLRRDRCIGLSNDQIGRVHQGARSSYDLKIDTTTTSPFAAARQILKFIEENPEPKAFQVFKVRG